MQIDGRRIFDGIASLYSRVRPTYPQELIESIISYSGITPTGRILEIGCGPGKATILFARRGYSMLCVEPGPNLVHIARQKCRHFPQVEFEVSTFEDWPVQESAFDLVIAASCYQWLQKDIALPKIAAALKPRGTLALFWNKQPRSDSPLNTALEEVYAEVVPQLARPKTGAPEDEFNSAIRAQVAELENSGYFDDLRVEQYPWSIEYSTAEYIALMDTYSDHQSLPDETKEHLYDQVSQLLDEHGGTLKKEYIALLYLARKMRGLVKGL